MSYSGGFPLKFRFCYVPYMIASFLERLVLEFWNLVTWEMKACRFQISKSICSPINPWLWTFNAANLVLYPNFLSDGAAEVLPSTSSGIGSSQTFCQVSGAKLEDHAVHFVNTHSLNQCASLCMQFEACRSCNYDTFSKQCDLNNVDFKQYSAVVSFNNLLTEDYVYMSKRQCWKVSKVVGWSVCWV